MNRRQVEVKPYTRSTGDVSGHTRGGYDLVPLDGDPRQLRVVRGEVVEPQYVQLPDRADVQPATTAHVSGSYTDRAKGFSISTWQLSAVTGLVAWIMGGVGGTALLSLAGLAWLVLGFFVVWLVAYAMHVFVSAEGTELFRAAGEYKLLREEQKERHRRYREMGGGR